MGHKSDIKLIVDGKRTDGRTVDQCREVTMEVNVIPAADGSAKVGFGSTVALASVYGPRELFPRFMQESDTGILRTRYNMAPFSVDDRKKPGQDRRSQEISKVMKHALEPVLFLQEFPKVTVDAFAEVIQADGSTRVTGINAVSLALVAAGIPMSHMVTAVSVGKADGELVTDLNGKEDNFGEADMGFAMVHDTGEVTLLQMDGELTLDEIKKLLDMAQTACGQILEKQKKALRDFYVKRGE
ncbi:MAG: exosome complex exonuclease Rrp41 [Candidatus Aenigmarchaeota archaeon]|nr:exosome complex exonuclease Rrp41 [Candidatus Aenigmarchaeota archaeon]